MNTTYYFQIYNVDATGKRTNLIAEGSTAQFGEKITRRTKKEQRKVIECRYGHGKSIYMKRETPFF